MTFASQQLSHCENGPYSAHSLFHCCRTGHVIRHNPATCVAVSWIDLLPAIEKNGLGFSPYGRFFQPPPLYHPPTLETMLTANRKTEDCAFLALLIGVTALFLWMMLPFFDVIFWAATIGILFHPVYRTIAEKWRMGRILSAFITILLCLVLIIIPLSYILYNCVVEATLLYQRLHSDQNSFVGYIDRIKESYPAPLRRV